MRRTDRLDRFQTDEPADTVFDMDNKIALGQARCLGDDIGTLGLAPGLAHEPVTENVLLADKGYILEFETVFDAEDAQCSRLGRKLVRVPECADLLYRTKTVIAQDLTKTVPGPLGPARNDRSLACALKLTHMCCQGVEYVDVPGRRRSAAKLRPCLPPSSTTVFPVPGGGVNGSSVALALSATVGSPLAF